MKSAYGRSGNINLKGKLRKILTCGCCVAEDFRPKVRDSIHLKEMREAFNEAEYDDNELASEFRELEDRQDRGHWETFTDRDGRIGISSSDFKHDVVLYVSGDFGTAADQLMYATMLAVRLNWTNPSKYEDDNW